MSGGINTYEVTEQTLFRIDRETFEKLDPLSQLTICMNIKKGSNKVVLADGFTFDDVPYIICKTIIKNLEASSRHGVIEQLIKDSEINEHEFKNLSDDDRFLILIFNTFSQTIQDSVLKNV